MYYFVFLKENNLRKISTPFDWMYARETHLCDYLYYFDDFSNFFKNRKCLYTGNSDFIKNDNNVNSEGKNLKKEMYFIIDTKTNMICNHYFPTDVDIDTFYNENFYPMMKRRFDRIISYIEQSENVLFISFSRKDSIKIF